MTIFRLGEFFAGPGGIAQGARDARIDTPGWSIEHAWATDYDADTVATYAHNQSPHRPESVICEDVRQLDYARLDRFGPIDGFAFGFPCNDFSVVGERKSFDGTFGPLYTYGVKALDRWQPRWFLAENVGGITADGALNRVMADLAAQGYRLNAHLYNFADYGVPQARRRVIIIGIHESEEVRFRVPSPSAWSDVDVSARTALEGIPADAPHQEPTRQSARVIERLSYIGPGENAWSANVPEDLRLNVPNTRLSHIYKRLHPDKPSYTITGSGGGGTHVYHWSENRALTNRERARLQTFPDDYWFAGSKESIRKQIGMAVPPKGAQVIFEALLRSFADEDYESVPASIREDD
ncbi:Modification methylase AplI [Pseudoclavibacter triregionum]|nr:Modification methylase AplI [Pseudoclavibacter triregionum]